MLPQHPEWVQATVQIIDPHIAGLPQDENVIWVSLNKTQIQNELSKAGYAISRYHIAQMLDFLGLKERSFRKDVPMRDVRYRNEQFEYVAATRDSLKEVGIPIVSIDTNKKELLGNFKMDGKALSNGTLKAFDHDFATFGNGAVVPHGFIMSPGM